MNQIKIRKHRRRIIKYKVAHKGIVCSIVGCFKRENTYHEITVTAFVALRFNLCERHYQQLKQEAAMIFDGTGEGK